MQFKDREYINVLNYNNYNVTISTRDASYMLPPASDGMPSKQALKPSEIIVINSLCTVFKDGTLRFEDEDEDEVYTNLRIHDWENILTNEQIKNILLNPEYDGLSRIISIKSSSEFERVRGIFTHLKYQEDSDISQRVDRIINNRYKELRHGIRDTKIAIKKKDVKIQKDTTDYKSENDELRNKLKEMEDMMAKILANQNKQEESKTENKTVNASSTAKASTKSNRGKTKK